MHMDLKAEIMRKILSDFAQTKRHVATIQHGLSKIQLDYGHI